MKKLLFSTKPYFKDTAFLIFRVGVSLMMITHGWSKIASFSERVESFPDPLGIGVALSLQLTIFAEFFCAILLGLGFMTRLVVIPLIIAMITAAFVIHGSDPFSDRELALMYLLSFIFLFLTGPGLYSVDGRIYKKKRY